MDNREFLIKLDELQTDYFSKLQALAETHQTSLGPQYRRAMEQVLIEASTKISAAVA